MAKGAPGHPAARSRPRLWSVSAAFSLFLGLTAVQLLNPSLLSMPAKGCPAERRLPAANDGALKEIFATVWASEWSGLFNLSNANTAPAVARYKVSELAKSVQAQGVDVVFTSFRWLDQEPTAGKYDFRLQDYVQQVVCSQGLKLAVLFDAFATPAWVREKYPDSVLVDGTEHKRKDVSFNHPLALELVHNWHEAALARLAAGNKSCIYAIQPSFNNEYETKYTQEYDSFQDYSPAAMAQFRSYMRSVHGGLQYWNSRWGTNFENWDAVKPPHFFQGSAHFNNTAQNLIYWDFQHFRHLRLHAAHEGCCMRAAAHGFRCILHFGEFMSSNDAIYAGGAVFTLAASPWLDYVVVDSNFQTSAGLLNDVRVVQLLISAMKPFGKKVFFEGAFEKFKDHELHERAVSLTVASGAHGVGFTNWLDRTEPTFFEDTLKGHRRQDMLPSGKPPSRAAAPSIAILTPYRSYWAFKGVPLAANGSMAKTDPQQERLFECLDKIEKAVPSLDNLQVFAVPAMLAQALPDMDQVWYVEPPYLLSGDAKAVATVRQRAAELGVPFHTLASPTAPIVLPECCPSV